MGRTLCPLREWVFLIIYLTTACDPPLPWSRHAHTYVIENSYTGFENRKQTSPVASHLHYHIADAVKRRRIKTNGNRNDSQAPQYEMQMLPPIANLIIELLRFALFFFVDCLTS